MDSTNGGDCPELEDVLVLPDISTCARRCAEAFIRHSNTLELHSSLLERERSERSQKTILKSLQDELGRFKIWAGNLGVFAAGHSSADYRLRYEPDIKDVIIRLLKRLENHLTTIPSAEKSHPVGDRQCEDDSASTYSSESSLGISDTSSQEANQDLNDESVSEDPVLESISDTITHLYRITAIIKKPRSTKEEDRVRAWLAREAPRLDEQFRDLESYVRWSINRTLPRLKHSPTLVHRLVQSVLFRRQRFLYRASHRMKLQRGLDELFIQSQPVATAQQTTSTDTNPNKETALPQPHEPRGKHKAVTFVDTVASSVQRKGFSMYAKSTVLSAISPSVREGLDQMDFPPPPKPDTGLIETICPYCSLPLSQQVVGRQSTGHWKRHVLLDLEPYVCLFEDCSSKVYKTKEEWVNHMAYQHTKVWSCQAEGHEDQFFQSADALVSHLQGDHTSEIIPEQISFMVDKCTKPAPDVFAALASRSQKSNILLACPFCEEDETRVEVVGDSVGASFPKNSYKRIRDHISGHLETLALLSLPEREDVDKTASITRGWSNSSARIANQDPGLEDLPLPTFEDHGCNAAMEDDQQPEIEEYWQFIKDDPTKLPKSFPALDDDDTIKKLRNASRAKLCRSDNTGSPEVLELARSWITKCKCINQRNVPQYPTRLIDLQELKEGGDHVKLVLGHDLKHSSPVYQYVTLTHCLEAVDITLSRQSMAQALGGVKIKLLPLMFREAMEFACTLDNVRFIWIDVLCIMQDDPNDWVSESQKLCDVWSNSFLNLTAAATTDSRDGLFVNRDPIPFSEELQDPSLQGRLSPEQLFWEASVYAAPVNMRGWAMQENLMNRRKLYFCNKQIAWECHEGQKMESHPEKYASYDIEPPRTALSSQTHRLEILDLLQEGANWRSVYRCWATVVNNFAKMHHTYDGDKLLALSSLARRFHSLVKYDYVAGMWARDLEFQLLWQVKKRWDSSRQMWVHQCSRRPREYRAPSFSWAAVDTDWGLEYGAFRGEGGVSFEANGFVKRSKGFNRRDPFGILLSASMVLIGDFPLKRIRVRRNEAVEDPFNTDYVGVNWHNPGEQIGNPTLDSAEGDVDIFGPDGQLYYLAATPAVRVGEAVHYTCLLLQSYPSVFGTFRRVGLITIIGREGKDHVRELSGDEESMQCIDWNPRAGEFGKHTIRIV